MLPLPMAQRVGVHLHTGEFGAAAGERSLWHAGATAWLLDQTGDAIRLLRAARNGIADPAARAASGGALTALGWAYLDAGWWDQALDLAAETSENPETDIASASANLITATIHAARGNTDHARTLVTAALAADPEHSRLVNARARHSLGLAAIADGDFLTAFGQLRQLFTKDGTPYHQHVSYLAVADLALATARAGRQPEARDIVRRISAPPSPRLRQLLARARGILADPADPDAYPDDVLADPAGEKWPFERAQLRLEYGEWLRRRRGINDAKPHLAEALTVFRTLGAGPWTRRAETELRACGIAQGGAPEALQDLTPQQRQIIHLAAQGMSNREIGQRLFLSPRTVGSHLYHAFPKLGVAGRNQLHLVLAQADAMT